MSQASYGYDYAITEHQFRITGEKQKEAGRIAQELLKLKGGPNLYNALAQYNVTLQYDENRNIVGLGLREDAYQEDGLEEMLTGIAECVEPGYIQFLNDEGRTWRLVFDGHTAIQVEPVLLWPALYTPQQQTSLSEALLREAQNLNVFAKNIQAIREAYPGFAANEGFVIHLIELLELGKKQLETMAEYVKVASDEDWSRS